MRSPRPALDEAALGRWSAGALGCPLRRILFEVGYLSQVVAAELDDGREVIIKVRPWAHRLVSCAQIHTALFDAGFPCPRPLTGVEKLHQWAVSAEALVADHRRLEPASDSPRLFAEALARFVDVARATSAATTSLQPSPPWADWDDRARRELWPEPDDRVVDLNRVPVTWVDAVAATVREFLLQWSAPMVVGHLDWYSANLGWRGRQLAAVFDWDSVGVQPEAAIAGLAAAVWPATGGPGEEATVVQSDQFLTAYASARSWSDSDMHVAWAAGVWVRCFDAKKAEAIGEDPGRVITKSEARDRLGLAGLQDDL